MSTESGPLSISLPTTTAKTTIPLIAEGIWVKLKFDGVKEKKLESKGDILEFAFSTVDPVRTSDGDVVNPGQPGSKLFKSAFLFGKDGPEAALKRATADVSRILDALLCTGDPENKKNRPARPEFNAELIPTLIGLTCWAKTKHRTGEYSGVDIAELRHESDMPQATA